MKCLLPKLIPKQTIQTFNICIKYKGVSADAANQRNRGQDATSSKEGGGESRDGPCATEVSSENSSAKARKVPAARAR